MLHLIMLSDCRYDGGEILLFATITITGRCLLQLNVVQINIVVFTNGFM